MSLSVEHLILRLEDPDTPVVWLDPSASEALWLSLIEALRQHGFTVYHLDQDSPAPDLATLGHRLAHLSGLPESAPSLDALHAHLLALPPACARGWVVVFRHPEALRLADEAAFEDFLETLESVHELRFARDGRQLKILVQD